MNREFLFSDDINLAPTVSKKMRKNESFVDRFNEKVDSVSLNSVIMNYRMNMNDEKTEKQIKDSLVKDMREYLQSKYKPYS